MTLGEKIKMHRKALGLTQTELGRKLGVQVNAVSKWECGRVEAIPTSKIKALAEIFNVKPSYLIDDDENEKPTVGEDDGLSDEKREAINAIYEALKNLSLEDLQAIGQVVAAISNRASPEQPRD
jgi:transcriptional regulator with XRE-family HTH domain